MLQLGDIVVPFTTSRNPLYPLECTITYISKLDSTGKYLYGVSGHTALFDEYDMRLVQSKGLQPKYNIGDTIITDKHKDRCIREGLTDDMVPGTIDAMEAHIVGMVLTDDDNVAYKYRTHTTSGHNICGTIDEADMPKHRHYSLF